MPYIIETTIPGCGTRCGEPEECERVTESRHAVATLEEAREHAVNAWYSREPGDRDEHSLARRDTCLRLPESGGTIGPLPDGTVIEVKPVDYELLRHLSGKLDGYSALKPVLPQIIAAYNVKGA
jgi:hypothetical protein